MDVNIEIVFLYFLKSDFLDLLGLWFWRQHSFKYIIQVCKKKLFLLVLYK